ncbi:hypothetical protein A4D02_27845 [Niastella koreensis]|uniref:Uncharacterized protein n=1 Tax=Niastella koreensis TaxID=354356 RepID=A0ABX3NZN0_9BACT|nr:hypothetical protein A4D02_27845 [Niastella koreensis]
MNFFIVSMTTAEDMHLIDIRNTLNESAIDIQNRRKKVVIPPGSQVYLYFLQPALVAGFLVRINKSVNPSRFLISL